MQRVMCRANGDGGGWLRKKVDKMSDVDERVTTGAPSNIAITQPLREKGVVAVRKLMKFPFIMCWSRPCFLIRDLNVNMVICESMWTTTTASCMKEISPGNKLRDQNFFQKV
jgi:hypothetical protein